jgi:hypothetical protein
MVSVGGVQRMISSRVMPNACSQKSAQISMWLRVR